MLVLIRAQTTSSEELTWITEYPTMPLKDYASFGGLPPASDVGDVSIFHLSASDMDQIWSASRASGTTTVYPNLGDALTGIHWSREVDSEVDIVLTLDNNNLSTSWARVNDTDLAPRRQV